MSPHHTVEFTDDRRILGGLSPSLVQGALGVLNWKPRRLADQAGLCTERAVHLQSFLDYGQLLDVVAQASIVSVLTKKVLFPVSEGVIGVCVRPEVLACRPPGSLTFGGPLKRRAAL